MWTKKMNSLLAPPVDEVLNKMSILNQFIQRKK